MIDLGAAVQGDREALAQIETACPAGARIVFVAGNFNILHPGHLRFLHFAADRGDYLVVGVQPAGTRGALMAATLRLEAVQALACVNYAFILAEKPESFITALRPAVVVKGKEHETQLNPESEAVASYGGQLLFSSGDLTFSSVELIRQEFSEILLSTIVKPADYPQRHGFGPAQLSRTMSAFRDLRVLVIGDLIVDDYVACDPVGMSQEDPTLVVTPVLYEKFVGGAGIVAGHAAGLGAKVVIVTVGGFDQTADFAETKISSFGVDVVLLRDRTRPTTLKQRFRAAGKTLLRVSHLKKHELSFEQQSTILNEIRARLDQIDLLVFSDFNYGCLPQALVDEISALARSRGVKMVADSQSSSQVGDISRFSGMLLIKPTEHEARLALRSFQSGLVAVAEMLRDKARATHVVVTMGSEGLLVHSKTPEAIEGLTDRLPAFNRAPKDAAGAGDCFLVSASLALAVGTDIWQSAYIGSIAAACQVGRVGNTPLTATDLLKEIDA